MCSSWLFAAAAMCFLPVATTLELSWQTSHAFTLLAGSVDRAPAEDAIRGPRRGRLSLRAGQPRRRLPFAGIKSCPSCFPAGLQQCQVSQQGLQQHGPDAPVSSCTSFADAPDHTHSMPRLGIGLGHANLTLTSILKCPVTLTCLSPPCRWPRSAERCYTATRATRWSPWLLMVRHWPAAKTARRR